MEEIKSTAFRSAMGGFNKKDVNDYIEALSRRHEEQMNQAGGQLQAANARIAELEKEADDMRTALAVPNESESLREKLQQTEALLDARAKQTDELTAELSALKEKLAQCEASLAAKTEQAEALTVERDAAREQFAAASTKLSLFAGMEEKLADYERMKAKMGEIYLEAAAGAGRIKTEAEAYAAARRADVDNELREARNAQFDRIQKLLSGMTDELLAIVDEYRAKAAELAGEMAEAPAASASPAMPEVPAAPEAPAEEPTLPEASDAAAEALASFVTEGNE